MSSSFCGFDVAKRLAAAAVQHVHQQCVALRHQTGIKHLAAAFCVMVADSTVSRNPYRQRAGQRLRLVQFFRKHAPQQQCQRFIIHHAGGRKAVISLKMLNSLYSPRIKGGSIRLGA